MSRKKEKIEETRYTREQLLTSNRFKGRRDVLGALVKEGELLTLAEVEERLEKKMKGKVD